MIDHTGIGVRDVVRSATFYDAALGAQGLRRVTEIDGGIGYGEAYAVFWIDRFHPADGKNHTAFVAKTRAHVDAFHAAAMSAGGTDNGKPGTREGYPPNYYTAFVRDPDGNNIEACYRG